MLLVVTGNSCVGKSTIVKQLAVELDLKVFDVDVWTADQYKYNDEFKKKLHQRFNTTFKSEVAAYIQRQDLNLRKSAITCIKQYLQEAFTRDLTHFLTAYNQHGIIDMAQFHESDLDKTVLQNIKHLVVCVTTSPENRAAMAALRGVDIEFMNSIQYAPDVKASLSDVIIMNDLQTPATNAIRGFVNMIKDVDFFEKSIIDNIASHWFYLNADFLNAFRYFAFRACAHYFNNNKAHHNIEHIKYMIKNIPNVWGHEDVDNVNLILAIMCHDIAYDPKSKRNEEDSVMLAHSMIKTFFGNQYEFVNPIVIAELILATKWGAEESKFKPAAGGHHIWNIQDLDLGILSEDMAAVYKYDVAISLEYTEIPRSIYFEKRIEFLHSILDLPQIYHRSSMNEVQARSNIQRLIERNRSNLNNLEEAFFD